MVEAKSPALLDVALASRALVFAAFPATVEVVWADQGTAGYGVGPKKMTEQFVWLAPYSTHLVFGFYLGARARRRTAALSVGPSTRPSCRSPRAPLRAPS